MKKLIITFLFLLHALTLFSEEGSPVNQWFEIPVKVEFLKGYEGGNYQNRHWSRMVYNSKDGHCYYYEGYLNSKLNIPQTIYGNTLYKINLEKKIIEMIAISDWKRDKDLKAKWYLEEGSPKTPFDRHTYGCFTYIDKLDGIMISHGASGGNSNLVMDTWLYSFTDNKWKEMPSVGDLKRPNANFENHLMHLPGSEYIYLTSRHVRDVVLHKFKIGDENWQPLEKQTIDELQTPVALWGANGKVDTKRNRFVFIGGAVKKKDQPVQGANQLICFDFKTEKFSTLPTEAAEKPWGFIRPPYFVYDSINDLYLVHSNVENVGTWAFDPNKQVWIKLDVGAGPDGNEFSAFDTKRGLMIVQFKGKVFGLKIDPKSLK